MTRRLAVASGVSVFWLAVLVTAQSQQPPTFRAGVTLINVDVYPRRDGRLVEGLRPEDFQVFEDGKPQAIDAFEFIRIEPNAPDAERRDPHTKEDGEEQAKDPHSRVFVIYLDTLHTAYFSAREARQPILDFLNRVIGPTDLFAVMTHRMPVRQLVLGRRSETVEADLSDLAAYQYEWNPATGDLPQTPEEEQLYTMCANGSQLLRLLREDQFMSSLEELMAYLGALRDERKDLLLVSGGWLPLDPGFMQIAGGGGGARTPSLPAPPRVMPGGAMGIDTPMAGSFNHDWCDKQTARLSNIDYASRFKNLLTRAQHANVSVYPIDPGGLRTPYTPADFGGEVGRPLSDGNLGPVGAARRNPTRQDPGVRKIEILRTLADNTDGRAIVNTNDIAGGFRRIADDLSAYYLLGYSSTNQTLDGKFRQIDVKLVNQRGVSVSARKGYVAAAPVAVSPPASGAALTDAVAEALARLPRSGEDDAPVPRPHATASILVGDPAGFRGTASPRVPLQSVTTFVFRRTERLHIEWPMLKALDEHIARLLDRTGRPLALAVALTAQPDKLAADLTFAPLAAGDYLIELTVSAGGQTEKHLLGFRVVR
jgi:VWFA-related protein